MKIYLIFGVVCNQRIFAIFDENINLSVYFVKAIFQETVVMYFAVSLSRT